MNNKLNGKQIVVRYHHKSRVRCKLLWACHKVTFYHDVESGVVGTSFTFIDVKH